MSEPTKPCPFCGSEAAPHIDCPWTNDDQRTVVCDIHRGGCGASGRYEDSDAGAIAAWNRRTPPEGVPEVGSRVEVRFVEPGDTAIGTVEGYKTVVKVADDRGGFFLADPSELRPAPSTDTGDDE